MSVSMVGGPGRGSTERIDPSKMASKLASKMLGELDANQDGSIDKKEFVTGMTTKGVSVADAGKMFDAIDTKKAGAINKSDIETAVKSGTLKPPPGGAPSGAGGKPPPDGGGGGGGGSSQGYDAADTNKDGTVSAQEALLYSMKHPSNTKSQMAALSSLGKNVDKTV